MADTPKILAFSGSVRGGSWNRKLVRVAAAAARDAGASVTEVDLRELNLPLYDEDLEARDGLPEGAKRLKSLMTTHHGLLIASPEYNSSISAALKNAIDWASRPVAGQPPLEAFNDKVAVLMSTSPGALGGLRGLVHLRAILGNINVTVLPQQFALSKSHEAFDANGDIKDAKTRDIVRGLGEQLVKTLRKLLA